MEMVSKLDVSQIAATNSKLPEVFRNPNVLAQTEKLKQHAKAVITTASTITGTTSTTWSGSEIRFSKIFSDDGPTLDATGKRRIEQWIPERAIEEEFSLQTDLSPETGTTSQSAAATSIRESELTDSESDGEIEVDIISRFLTRGQHEYNENRHAEAIKLFRTGLQRASSLTLERKVRLKTRDFRLKLGYSHLYQGDLVEAEGLFIGLVKHTSDDENLARALHASSGLAQVHLCRQSFRSAEYWCKKCMIGWKRLFGKEHSFYITSLWLMEFIHETEGDPDTAGIFSDLVLATKTENHEHTSNPPGFQPEKIRTLVTRSRKTSAETLLSSLGFDTNSESFSADEALLKLSGLKSGENLRSNSNMALTAQYLLNRGANVNARNISDVTALISASRLGHTDIVQLLCVQGADVNQKSFMGNTALHAAAREGHLPIVKLLCERGVDVNAKGRANSEKNSSAASGEGLSGFLESLQLDPSSSTRFGRANTEVAHLGAGTTAMIEAAYGGYMPVVKFLLNRGANMEQNDNNHHHTVLLAAVSRGQETTVQYILKAGANIETDDNSGYTALHLAVLNGFNSLTELLLNSGARTETASSRGTTPLIAAASKGNARAVELLLNAGAYIEARDDSKMTALIHATRNSCDKCVEVLLSRGASTETPPDIMAPLHIAICQDNRTAVKLLLEAGANPELKCKEDCTPLIHAVRMGHSNIAESLLAHRIPTEAISMDSHTAFLTAAIRGDLDMAKMLLDAGANLEARRTGGATAVIAIAGNAAQFCEWAPAHTRRVEMMRLLCERGANLAARDSSGKTALKKAGKDSSSDKKLLVQILKSHGAK